MTRDPAGCRGDDGQITLLVLAYALIAFCLVAVAIDATAVHLARTQLLDAADAAALDAADALDVNAAYGDGIDDRVPLTDEAVRTQAATYLASYAPPSRLDRIELGPGTGAGAPDRAGGPAAAQVELVGRVHLPVAAAVVDAFSDGITISVRASARADLDP